MKTRITVTLDEETDNRIRDYLKKELYLRNKSHLVEVALKEFIEKRDSKQNDD